ncbi:hypothetical protein DM02DRAFT_107245 [Periconia macrospinosa]|uniref:Uncharacterized protein n=1 Tax=Periconia macrospinosa TaxID=97972 RepID=A0A2V1DEQ8_9PLEO|nr:hypothetical protein DM02DRAFT_107245 [Periconia macrospinosa]
MHMLCSPCGLLASFVQLWGRRNVSCALFWMAFHQTLTTVILRGGFRRGRRRKEGEVEFVVFGLLSCGLLFLSLFVSCHV